ncbi:MAG TPA: adenylate/guanylate cyclase domain-containing protein [Porticoccaceae bacterium]|nr:adenylate/guanylate cyclase domain-containing protein [Porticoccaceae bacterium]
MATQYLQRNGIKLAYQVAGSAARDLIIVPGIVSHVEFAHEIPGYSHFIARMTEHFRVITFDKRGNGLSGRLQSAPTLEQRMDDIRLIMDEVGSDKAVIFGFSEGGALSALYSAMHPERVDRLIIFGSFAVVPGLEKVTSLPPFIRAPLLRWKVRSEQKKIRKNWGNGDFIKRTLPTKVMVDGKLRRVLQTYEESSTTPEGMANMIDLISQVDVRPFLKDVHCPTLVMHSHDDRLVPFHCGHALQAGIEHAEFVELNEAGHNFFMHESDTIINKVFEFAGSAVAAAPTDISGRILATILFNDIVDSTRLQASLGDAVWREKMRQFITLTREHVTHFEGHFIKSMGDGVLAIFSGPTRAIECAVRIKEDVKSLGLDLRTGLHVGEIERFNEDISGINVNAASRIQSLAAGDQVLVSSVLKSLVFGSGITFKDVGDFELKGFDEQWRLAQVITVTKP